MWSAARLVEASPRLLFRAGSRPTLFRREELCRCTDRFSPGSNRGAHFPERFYSCEAGAGFDTGIGGRHAHAIPLFFLRILGGKVEDFVCGIRWIVPR